MEILGWIIVAAIFVFLGTYFYISYLIYSRLKKSHLKLWQSLTYRPSSELGKELYEISLWGLSTDLSALYKFVMKKIYMQTDDETLIKLGKTLRLMCLSWFALFIGFIVFMWIKNFV